MNDDQRDQVLYARFGTSRPCWRLSADSNALELTPVTGAVSADVALNVAIALNPRQASQIRCITGASSHLVVDVHLAGEPLRLHLVGKKIDSNTWGGTASAYEDTESVVHDLAQALSFAEQVVSEVNSVVVVVDRHGRIQRFNRVAEELSGIKEESIIGRTAWALLLPSRDEATASANFARVF